MSGLGRVRLKRARERDLTRRQAWLSERAFYVPAKLVWNNWGALFAS